MTLTVGYHGGTRYDITSGTHRVVTDQPIEAPYDAPAPAPKKSFPWGVLGLLGLLGMLGRKRG